MKFDEIMNKLEGLTKLYDLLKPLLDRLPAGTLEKLAAAAAKAIDKLSANGLADKAMEALEKAVAKASGGTAAIAREPLKCRLARCWDGANASKRYMNMLGMSDAKFEQYKQEMLAAGCDTAHLLLLNRADGENAGYSLYGKGGSGTVDKAVATRFATRLQDLRKAGFHLALWGVADDSDDWAADMLAHAADYVRDLRESGILALADLFVLGLEMDEYGSESGWRALRDALRDQAPDLYLCTHHASAALKYAALGDGVMGQLSPGCTTAQVAAQIAKIKALGKGAWGFEYARGPARNLAQAALDAGAIGVGNW